MGQKWVRRKEGSVCSVPWSHCPYLHKGGNTGEVLPAAVTAPYSTSPFCLYPPPNLSPIYELCIVNHVSITEKSFYCHITWEMGATAAGSRSCKLSTISATSPCRHRQSSSTTGAPAACTASQSLLHRENHCQSCVFQREALVYTGLMVLTVSLLLHCSLKTRCGLWFATRLSTKLAWSK